MLNTIYSENLIKRSLLRNFIMWMAAINLFFFFFYHSSILFSLLGENYNNTLLGIFFLGVFSILSLSLRVVKLQMTDVLRLYSKLFIPIILMIVFTHNYTGIREVMSLVIVIQIIVFLKYTDILSLLKKIAIIHFVFLVSSIVVLFFVAYDLVDFELWNVLNLDYIYETHPLHVKAICCDKNFYNPWYFLLATTSPNVDVIGIGWEYNRMMLIWNEPTGIALYTVPLLLFLASQVGSMNKIILIVLSIILLLLSRSLSGIILFLLTVIVFYMRNTHSVIKSMLMIFFIFTIMLSSQWLPPILPIEKFNTLELFFEATDLSRQFSWFGLGAKTDFPGYGFTFVYLRYGIVGIFTYLSVYSVIFYKIIQRVDVKYSQALSYYFNGKVIIFCVLYLILMSSRLNQIVLPIVLLMSYTILELNYLPKNRS
jgi:hypothetical protein